MGIILQYISYNLSDLVRLWKDDGEWVEGRNPTVAAATISREISGIFCYSFHFYSYLIIYCIILSCRSHFVKGYMSYSSKIWANCHVLEKLKSFVLLCYFSCCSRDSWNSFSSKEAEVLGLSMELLTLSSNKTRFIPHFVHDGRAWARARSMLSFLLQRLELQIWRKSALFIWDSSIYSSVVPSLPKAVTL